MSDVIAHVGAIDYLVIRHNTWESYSYVFALVLDLMNDGRYGLSYSCEGGERFVLNSASLAHDASGVDVDNCPFYGRASNINTQD